VEQESSLETHMTKLLFAAFAMSAVLSAGAALAETQTYRATLTGAAETPPNESTGIGTAVAVLETGPKTLTWKIDYSGLSGPATMAHFHGPAAAGVAAGVQIPMEGAMDSPLKGAATLTAAQVADLQAGRWYVNIHTAKFPKGEIRGQLAAVAP
jgi:hypothetical protein